MKRVRGNKDPANTCASKKPRVRSADNSDAAPGLTRAATSGAEGSLAARKRDLKGLRGNKSYAAGCHRVTARPAAASFGRLHDPLPRTPPTCPRGVTATTRDKRAAVRARLHTCAGSWRSWTCANLFTAHGYPPPPTWSQLASTASFLV